MMRGQQQPGRDQAGFSLIEALVALAILAIASVGLVGAVEQHIDSTRAMERRAAAMWVAEHRMAQIALADPAAVEGPEVAMLGERWRIETARRTTDDPEIARVRVSVFAADENSALATLDGFADTPQPRDRGL